MSRHILHLSLDQPDPDTYRQALELLEDITPYVQALPPAAADADVAGALSYFRTGPLELGQLLQLRLAVHLGVQASIGVAGNRMLAAMTAAAHPGVTSVLGGAPDAVSAFLHPQPARALPGIGRATAALLARHGLRTVGAIADTPLPTLQRLLGNTIGRAAHQHACGLDPRPIIAQALPAHLTNRYRFPHDELDPRVHRRAILALAEQTGLQLRRSGRRTRRLTLTVRYADESATTRSKAPLSPTDQAADIVNIAGLIYQAFGLQRARVRGIDLRAEELVDRELDHRQLSLDPRDHRLENLLAAADRARTRFGASAVIPAELAERAAVGKPRQRRQAAL